MVPRKLDRTRSLSLPEGQYARFPQSVVLRFFPDLCKSACRIPSLAKKA
jgi:hypothetical protein